MKTTRRQYIALMGATAAAAALPMGLLSAEPTTHIVEMLNKDPDDAKSRMIYKPAVLQVNVGDTVKFVAEDKGHNAESDKNMIPEGGDTWKGKINEEVEVTFTTEGTYGYYCTPHRATGMVGLILVGDPSSNFEEARGAKQRGKAKGRYEEYFEEAEVMMQESGTG
ncbi:MAG: pseudoazurin [Pseudomonadota bacterium]